MMSRREVRMAIACGTVTWALLCGTFGSVWGQAPPDPVAAVEDPECDPKRLGWKIAPFPVAFYSSETGFGGGAGGAVTYRGRGCPPPARPQSVSGVIFYTAKGQSLLALAPEFYFAQEAWELKLGFSYRNFPDRIFGVGRDTPDEAQEDYTIEGMRIEPWILRRVATHLYMGMLFDLQQTHIRDADEGGLLARGLLEGHEGGVRIGVGPVIDWDSRDNPFFPARGAWYQAYTTHYHADLGSEYDFATWTLDMRQYFSPRPNHIFAFQWIATGRSGTVPFDRLGRLGDLMRGIESGRVQDRFVGVFRGEYRFPLAGRLGGVLFGATGDVASVAKNFSMRDPQYTGGLGLRFALNPAEKINFRFDLGISRWGAAPYFQFAEAF